VGTRTSLDYRLEISHAWGWRRGTRDPVPRPLAQRVAQQITDFLTKPIIRIG
jgi:hypothetical protein